MTRNLTVALALALPLTALAFEHSQIVWTPNDMPLDYSISNWVEDSLPVAPEGEDPYERQAVIAGHAAWRDAECAEFEVVEVPGVVDVIGDETLNTGAQRDGLNKVFFDDPAGALPGGVLGVSSTWPSSEQAFEQDGKIYIRAYDSDIVFNNDVDWATDEDIDAGVCSGEVSLQAVATHEIGHFWGLSHSCEEGDPCNDQDWLEATMFWTASSCDTSSSTINADDIAGITALYGPFATFTCSNELSPGDPDTLAFGIVPFELKCVMQSKDRQQVQSATWYWGDGEVSTEIDASHEYTEPGNYSINVCFVGENEACGEWQYCYTKTGYVRACGVPEAEFTFDHIDGTTYQLLNNTDVSVYGCIFDIQWDIFGPDSNDKVAEIQAWEPRYTFEEEGEYRVVLNVGGPAGTGAAELTIDVKNRRGEGYGACNSAGALGGLGLALLPALGALGLRRRRRR